MSLLSEAIDLLIEIEALADDNADFADDTGPSMWVDMHPYSEDIKAVLYRLRNAKHWMEG